MVITFSQIIGWWPSPDHLAAEVGAKPETARKWRQRGWIAPRWWLPIMRAANARGLHLTTEHLVAAATQRTPAPTPARRKAKPQTEIMVNQEEA